LLALLAAATGTGCDSRPPAPSFAYTLLDGAQGRTEALRGKVLLVNFWATSCATCVREMPALAALHRRYEARGLATLAVSMRLDPPAAVADFAEQRGLPFGVVIDNAGAIARAFPDLQATPTTYVIDKRGAIARRYVGEPDFSELHALVEALLAENAAAA
jgi:peroxiredoxin